MERETLSALQKTLLSYRKERPEKYVDEYLISTTKPFERLLELFLKLFDVDLLDDCGNGAFLGTPAQFRSVLDELLVLAEIWGVDLGKAVWRKYPDKCPYCLAKPCGCGGQKKHPHRRLRISLPEKGLSLSEAQRMLTEVYPSQRSLYEEIRHVVEEIDEVQTEIASLGKDRDTQDEFADVLARIAALATHLGIHLEGLIP